MKRPRNMGKHTTTSTTVRRKLDELFKQPGVDRIILGLSTGCSHSIGDGNLKFQREEKGKIHLNAYSKSGITKIVVILTEKADIATLKAWIKNANQD